MAERLSVHLACNDDRGNFDFMLFAVEIHDGEGLLATLEYDPIHGLPFDIDAKTGELVFGETAGDRHPASGRARWAGNMAWDAVTMDHDAAVRFARFLITSGFVVTENVCAEPWQSLDDDEERAMPDSVALDCDHCGAPAIESPTNEFHDGDGGSCMTCGWPGWVSADGEIEEGAYWVCADEGRCSLDDCEECRTPRTTVVNLRKEPFDVYIGRAGKGQDGYFGNPYRVHRNLGADHLKKILDLYRSYFAHRIATDPEFRRRVLGLRGKRLGCFCKPGPCHGDVIAEWVDSQPVEGAAHA